MRVCITNVRNNNTCGNTYNIFIQYCSEIYRIV